MSNFIFEESAPAAPVVEDDDLVYDESADVSEDTQKSRLWSAAAVTQALQKSSEDESWGVEGLEKVKKIPENHLSKALPSEETNVSPEKARKILHDGEVGGKPLTDQQRKFFGAIASKGEARKSMDGLEQLKEHFEKAGPYIGSKGGKWQDPGHKVPWKDPKKRVEVSRTPKADVASGLKKDQADLERAKANLKKLQAGQKVENLTVEGAKSSINGLTAAIVNKKKLLSKKTEKSMSTTTGLDALEKSLFGYSGGGLEWASRMTGTPFEVEALQCVKKFAACDAERAEIRKKYPYGGYDDKNRVERAKLSQKRDDAYKKIEVKENAERKKQSELEAKYLDWRIEQAKETKKSEDPMQKSDIPTGQPTKVPTGETGGHPEDGGPLAGVGKTADTNAPNPDADQDAQGQPTGVPASTVQDWGLDDEARRVMGGVGGITMKSMGSLDKDRAIAEQRLSKSAPDVHPYQMSAIHGDAEARVALLSKGGVNESDPRNAIISQDILCKSCSNPHPAMLTACPNCGDGAIGREVLYKGSQGVTLDGQKGVPILQPPKREEDILIGE